MSQSYQATASVSLDDVFVALTYRGGIRAHLWMSATAAHLGLRFRILGSRASYTISGMDVQEEALRAGSTPHDPSYGIAAPSSYGRIGTPDDDRVEPTEPGTYQDFYPAVVQTLRTGATPPVTLADAITGLEIIEAAVRSTREHTLVNL